MTFEGDYRYIAFGNSVSSSSVTIKAINYDGYEVKEVSASSGADMTQNVMGNTRVIRLTNITSDVTVTFYGVDNPWIGFSDGVYAIKADGTPVAYAFATDDSYSAVAFLLNGRAYQVAKTDAIGYDGETFKVVWWKTGGDISDLTNYTTADDNLEWGYLPKSDGSYGGTFHIDSDWTNWSSYSSSAALSDFNGKKNTEKIIAAQTTDGVVQDYTLAKAVLDFRNNSTYNDGQTDWFAPAEGELAFMFLKKAELEDLLVNKVSGSAFLERTYWSSSEYNSIYVWYVNFTSGNVDMDAGKTGYAWLRLIRAI